jgi:molecular chaperone DnaJ
MDFYVVLGVGQTASEADIKRAYRRLARRFHPDINPGDRAAEDRFREILAAYETLVDPDRRLRYDRGATEPGEMPRVSGFQGFDFTTSGSDHSGTFGDLVAEVLTERHTRRPPKAERGADLHLALTLSFEEALAGTQRAVSVTRRDTCRRCSGAGTFRSAGMPCLTCEGSGAVRSVRGHMVFSRTCPACGGSGQQPARGCEACGGLGLETRADVTEIRLPAGVAQGDRVRVAGRGHAGVRGGEPGDLYIAVDVEPHATVRREGDDLHMTLLVAVHEAALGARIEFDALDGPARLRIPPGTQTGQRFRLSGRGAPSTRGGPHGDLVVEVRLMLPAVLDERSRELLRELGRLNGDSVRQAVEATRTGTAGKVGA